METYKFVADVDEIRFFWDYALAPLKRNEVYFVSLSARNKKLQEEERQYYQVSRSEMFAKQQIRHDSFKEFLKHIYRFEVNKDAYITKGGVHYPEKTLVCYVNICPIDAYKAMKDQIHYLTEVLGGLSDSALKGSQNGVEDGFYKVRKSFDTCQSLFARNFGTKTWLDFDVDGDLITRQAFEIRDLIYREVNCDKGDVMIIQTGGGYHFFVRKAAFHINPDYLRAAVISRFSVTEVIHNKNEMCALPGTYMYGGPIVRVINKEDFEDVSPFDHAEE
jgi:hypothetical protein